METIKKAFLSSVKGAENYDETILEYICGMLQGNYLSYHFRRR